MQTVQPRSLPLRLPRVRPGGVLPILAILAVLLVLVGIRQPDFLAPQSLMSFLGRSAPIILLAAGQYFVIVSGEFDLSVGSLVTAQVVVAARLIDSDPARTWPVVLLLLAFGALVGLVNGLITTRLRVPSFITTLGMFLILVGAVYLWSDGAPKGGLSEEFRRFGRRAFEDVPVLGRVPYALLVLVVLAVAAVLLMRSDFGRTLVAVGDNPRTAELSGVSVWRTRTFAFILSGLAAAVAAILLGGYSGVSFQAGAGLEFGAITAVVLGGVALGGGRGAVVGAMLGALTLELLFALMNFYGVSGALRSTVQGGIILLAVAVSATRSSSR
ncbi:putative ABC transporter permease protein [Micromonospora noduli]|uniref:Putative ABC transporter permease protein n=1 Tax=Micromonospora noduli TaxID=709876 RepID=A0A328N045_9ACTN|nr:ABC transporter permease [Micromonospora noduli]KAB1928362.1 ABC transporter permease [Micromonospora noduli]RAN99142.1 putative ABC transporter permease protein [Micromonospora noduli]RAO16779.1 putative ABC transporter permease protein [Micromonospora noduli]RAO33792.1 putative ABC transporter permease protein [Micromonospora noduli]RAO36551.1 putative ABC transporter permease protein [Micromonospora noduli]